MSVCSGIIGFILCVSNREVPMESPTHTWGLRSPPIIFGVDNKSISIIHLITY